MYHTGNQSLNLTAPKVSAATLALYQLQFATLTCAIIFGAVNERVRILPAMLFIFAWTTLIYDPIAHWVWSARGWIKNMSCMNLPPIGTLPCQVGGIDFAGIKYLIRRWWTSSYHSWLLRDRLCIGYRQTT